MAGQGQTSEDTFGLRDMKCYSATGWGGGGTEGRLMGWIES